MDSLIINDLNKLKITKITDYKVYFDYDNIHYFLKEDEDCGERWVTLYTRELYDNGIVRDINRINSCGCDLYDILGFRYKRGLTYNNNKLKKKFVISLSRFGIAKTLYDKEAEYIREHNNFIYHQIDILRNKLDELYKELL